MDCVYEKLVAFGFKQVNLRRQGPLIVHCVPGAGKSTLIRELVEKNCFIRAVTFGVPDSKNLLGTGIGCATTELELSKDCKYIVDEYTEGDWERFSPIAIFGDPIQNTKSSVSLRPHFISNFSYRFGGETALFLKTFGFEIEASGVDSVKIEEVFGNSESGVVLAVEKEAQDFLEAHCVEYKKVCEFRGSTFDEVTVVTSLNTIPEGLRAHFYLAFTRHRKSLRVLCPNAIFSSA